MLLLCPPPSPNSFLSLKEGLNWAPRVLRRIELVKPANLQLEPIRRSASSLFFICAEFANYTSLSFCACVCAFVCVSNRSRLVREFATFTKFGFFSSFTLFFLLYSFSTLYEWTRTFERTVREQLPQQQKKKFAQWSMVVLVCLMLAKKVSII